jgi:ribosomal protein L7/L12
MPDGRFAVILPHLNGYPYEEIRDKLAELFSVLKSTADRIVKSAPIVLLEDATAEEIEYIRNLLGIPLTIYPISEINGNFPKLAWPKRPAIRIVAGQAQELELLDNGETFGEVEYVEDTDRVVQIKFEEAGKAATTVAATVKTPPAPKPAEPKRGAGEKPMFGNGNDASDIFVYNVFLMKIASESKRQRAKELISKIRGVSMLEAEEIMDRAIVPIVKGVTKKEAEQIQEMFRSDRIAVQVLKKPK